MALSAQQTRRCFEIARIIIADTATVHNGYGIVLTLTNITELRERLEMELTGLDAASETEVASLITLWDTIRLKTGKIEGGSAGNISGATYSFDEHRARIKEVFQTYVPVIHIADSIARREDKPIQQPSANVRIAR